MKNLPEVLSLDRAPQFLIFVSRQIDMIVNPASHVRPLLRRDTTCCRPEKQSQSFYICFDLTTVKKENYQNSTPCSHGDQNVRLLCRRTKSHSLLGFPSRVRSKPVVLDRSLGQMILCPTNISVELDVGIKPTVRPHDRIWCYQARAFTM